MSGINRAKISAKLYNQLDKKGLLKSINILRSGKNAFNETVNDLFVCTIQAYYYKSDLKLHLQSIDAASLTTGYESKLLVICNAESNEIHVDDYFTLNDVKYKIIDLGSVEGIVFDMALERM